MIVKRRNGAVVSRVAARDGTVTLSGELPREVLYAQGMRNGKAVGSAVCFVPMLSPQVATLDGKNVKFSPDEDQAFSGWRTFVEEDLLLETSEGRMRFRLRPDAAPGTVGHVRAFVKGGLYDGTIWHRVVAKRADGSPFVIQGGDPAGTGSGGPGWAYPLEDSSLPHDRGVISIARSTDPNTNGCQIFICLSRAGTKHLDHRYASFGQMIEGDGVLAKIGRVKIGANDRPVNPPKILRARLVPAAPRG